MNTRTHRLLTLAGMALCLIVTSQGAQAAEEAIPLNIVRAPNPVVIFVEHFNLSATVPLGVLGTLLTFLK